ncbi:sugar-binding transcriptional regulator [Domibacillus sp. DTU_2020_1001157_1_SI_ALB_TIR_016]|uniref:sugar-binding transcriptional regulator n=1 Tax=Domibacillus sp. DTU_2020_1001157_1_SI_ALB_TIR_016 TaxID=3077789 RepID=UPI0028E3370E|nr:sugar-binding transcriptional regulator [Domibacillus sp. DTU_2020_1001157_1_SI_ALB_TIR_016]WNS78281.1 sugar-binding transcriptional regulator [Domibacillus sp. DTU_2020_1001157_1_SI_ALB_TIR_016]
MDSREEKKLMVRIAQMYYEEDMTQSAISKELGIYRTSISRWLKKAREEGIVNITIKTDIDETFDLEQRIAKIFNLREVIILPVKKDQTAADKKKAVATAGADLLKRIIKDDDVVGFAWGTTMSSMIGEFHHVDKKDAHFVPLVGGPGPMDTKYHVNTIVYNIAEDFDGTAYFIDAAAVVERKETKDDIVQSNYFSKITELWDNLTIAVVGIGNPNQSSNLVWAGFCGDQEIEELNRQGAIGDICSRFYDIKGTLIRSDLSERTIAIEIEKLRGIPYSIGVAESIEKAPSIIGGLRGGFINTLVTTEETAEEMLRLIEQEK